MARLFLIAAFLFAVLVRAPDAAASPESSITCANLLASGGYKVILRQAHELGVVASAEEVLPLEELYLRLKKAEWEKPDLESLRPSLQSARQKQFQIEELTANELEQFRANSLHALYIRAAELWYIQEVRTQVGPVMKPEIEETLARMLQRRFTPWALEDRDLTPEAAREQLRAREWMRWPWTRIAGFLSEWHAHAPGKKFDSADFSKFWEECAASYGLDFDMHQRMLLALNRPARTPVCCLSEPGCVNCPHNRRWRRR